MLHIDISRMYEHQDNDRTAPVFAAIMGIHMLVCQHNKVANSGTFGNEKLYNKLF